MPDYLTGPERESVFLSSDASPIWEITTHQRKMISKLRNAGWEPVEDLNYHGQPGYRFHIPYNALTIRSKDAVERKLTEEQITQRKANLVQWNKDDSKVD